MDHPNLQRSRRREAVADYPRPPRVERTDRHLLVVFGGEPLAETHRAHRVLETSHPPTYYFPPEDVRMEGLVLSSHVTWCEWKGLARYLHIRSRDRRVENAAWYYPHPTEPFAALCGYIAFYPGRMDACYVDGELVRAQPSDFYGGWITSDIITSDVPGA